MTIDHTHYSTDTAQAKRLGLRPSQRDIEVRWETAPGLETDDTGQRLVDEIVATGVHLELMDEANCWMDVQGLRVWFRAARVKGQRDPVLYVTATPELCSEDEIR